MRRGRDLLAIFAGKDESRFEALFYVPAIGFLQDPGEARHRCLSFSDLTAEIAHVFALAGLGKRLHERGVDAIGLRGHGAQQPSNLLHVGRERVRRNEWRDARRRDLFGIGLQPVRDLVRAIGSRTNARPASLVRPVRTRRSSNRHRRRPPHA